MKVGLLSMCTQYTISQTGHHFPTSNDSWCLSAHTVAVEQRNNPNQTDVLWLSRR